MRAALLVVVFCWNSVLVKQAESVAGGVAERGGLLGKDLSTTDRLRVQP